MQRPGPPKLPGPGGGRARRGRGCVSPLCGGGGGKPASSSHTHRRRSNDGLVEHSPTHGRRALEVSPPPGASFSSAAFWPACLSLSISLLAFPICGSVVSERAAGGVSERGEVVWALSGGEGARIGGERRVCVGGRLVRRSRGAVGGGGGSGAGGGVIVPGEVLLRCREW